MLDDRPLAHIERELQQTDSAQTLFYCNVYPVGQLRQMSLKNNGLFI